MDIWHVWLTANHIDHSLGAALALLRIAVTVARLVALWRKVLAYDRQSREK